MVSKEILEKFKKLYEEKYGVVLTHEEATQMATDLINLMEVLLKPEDDKNEERRENEPTTAHL